MTAKQAGAKWLKVLNHGEDVDLNGFSVEAEDGVAGKVEQVLFWSDARFPDYVVIDSGGWFFGHKSVLSIRVIEDIDTENRRLRINLSKRQIREAPEFLPCA